MLCYYVNARPGQIKVTRPSPTTSCHPKMMMTHWTLTWMPLRRLPTAIRYRSRSTTWKVRKQNLEVQFLLVQVFHIFFLNFFFDFQMTYGVWACPRILAGVAVAASVTRSLWKVRTCWTAREPGGAVSPPATPHRRAVST